MNEQVAKHILSYREGVYQLGELESSHEKPRSSPSLISTTRAGVRGVHTSDSEIQEGNPLASASSGSDTDSLRVTGCSWIWLRPELASFWVSGPSPKGGETARGVECT